MTFDTSSVPVLVLAKQESERFYLSEVQQGLITPNEYRTRTGKEKVDAYLADSMLANPNLAPIGNTEEPMPKEEAMPEAAAGAPMGMEPGMPAPGAPPGEEMPIEQMPQEQPQAQQGAPQMGLVGGGTPELNQAIGSRGPGVAEYEAGFESGQR